MRWRAPPGKMQRECILTSGWSKSRSLRQWWRRNLAIATVWLALVCVPAFAQQQQAPPTTEAIRVSVDRVDVGVIVTDAKGNFVANLRQQDFQVLDNNSPQAITDFASVEAPAQVLMTVEAGPAVYLLQDSHVFVADALLAGLSAGDRIAIAYYNNAA